MPIPKLTAKYSISVPLMDKEVLLNTPSSAPTEQSSTKTTSSVIGGSTSIVLKLKTFILLTKILQLNERPILKLVLLMNQYQDMVLLHPPTTTTLLVPLLTTIMLLQQKLQSQLMLLKKKLLPQLMVVTEPQKLKHPKTNTTPAVKDVTSVEISVKDETSVETVAVTEEDKTTATTDDQDVVDVKADDSVDKCSMKLINGIKLPDRYKLLSQHHLNGITMNSSNSLNIWRPNYD